MSRFLEEVNSSFKWPKNSYFSESAIVETEEDNQKLIALAEEYIRSTEAYDKTVCSGPIVNGSIMPANAKEARMITKNAVRTIGKLSERANILGFSSLDLLKAIQRSKFI